MATEGASSSTFPVFVDTNLETHLLILVSSDDTVADLKGKIRTEHLLSFPDTGEISVQAMKVKRRGSFYSLSNSMVVRRAFEGIKGARFLYTDLLPATSMVESETELAKDIERESDVQPNKHNLLKTGHDAKPLAIKGEDRNRDSFITGLATEKSLIGTLVPSIFGSETLPTTHLEKPACQGLVKKRGREVPRIEEPFIEGDAAAGSPLQQKSKQAANQENKDGMGEDHGNAGIGDDMGVPVASKKEKSRKRRNAMEIDQLPDGKSEQPNVEKKRRKRDRSSWELVKETVVPDDSFEEKHDDNLVPSEGFPCKTSHVDSSLKDPVDAKLRRQKRKHISKNDETPQNEMVDSSLNKTDDALQGNQAVKDDHAERLDNHAASRNDSGAVDLTEESTQKTLETVLPENRVQEKHGINMVSTEGKGIPSKQSDIDSSFGAPAGAKQKRKKKKHVSKNDETPQNEMVDSLLNKTDGTTQGNQAVKDDHAKLVPDHADLRNKHDAANFMEVSTQKILEMVFPGNGVRGKHGTNLVSSEEIPSKPSDIDSSFQAPVDSKQKRKKKKHLSKSDMAPENDVVDKSLDGANDASQGKQPSEENNVEELVKNHAELGKESDATIDLKEGTPKKHGLSEELCMKDPLSAKESNGTPKPSIDFHILDENFREASENKHAQLIKVTDVVITDADLANKSAMESGILSESGAKSSHRSKRKKREKVELPNTQSNPHETVNSGTDQVPEVIQNKTSSTHQEQLVASSVLSRPIERKKKRGQEKSEEMELHQESNLQSGTQEAVNSSMDCRMEELSKEISIKHLEAASLQEAVERSSKVQSIVPSNPNDKKSKRSGKKSDKIELPSVDPVRAEFVQSLLDEATKKNPEESLKGSHGKTLGGDLGNKSKDSEVTDADSTVLLNPSDKKSKRSRKKSGKTELPNEEYSKDEAVHPLEKEAAKENPGGTLNGICIGMDANSESATVLREAAGLESVTGLNLLTTSVAIGINSSRNYDLDHSLENECTNENLEIISGTTYKSPGNELNARINPDEISLSVDHTNISNYVPAGFDDSCDNHKIGCLSEQKENTIVLEKAGEIYMKTFHETVHNTSVEAEDHRQLTNSDNANANSVKNFDPNLNQPEEVRGSPSVETETNKTNKEKTRRKKKLNLSPEDSTINLLKPTVSSEQLLLQKKPQDSYSGKHGLVAPAADNNKGELKSRKIHEKRHANKTQKSDMHLHVTSLELGSHDDRVQRKIEHHGSDTNVKGSPRVDNRSKHPIGQNSTSTSSKLHSLTRKEDTDTMVSAGGVSKHKIDDASVRSRTGGAAVAKYSSSAVAKHSSSNVIHSEEDMVSLAASSDSTEDGTPIQKKRYRVAVRKVPSKRYANVSNKSSEDKTLLAASAAIFSDAASGSSEDEFEISNRHAAVRATSDKSSTSADSDWDLEETKTGSESTEYCKADKGTNIAVSSLTKSSHVRTGKPLSAILKSSSSYKKAKLTASQSEYKYSESQPFDVVPETQPE